MNPCCQSEHIDRTDCAVKTCVTLRARHHHNSIQSIASLAQPERGKLPTLRACQHRLFAAHAPQVDRRRHAFAGQTPASRSTGHRALCVEYIRARHATSCFPRPNNVNTADRRKPDRAHTFIGAGPKPCNPQQTSRPLTCRRRQHTAAMTHQQLCLGTSWWQGAWTHRPHSFNANHCSLSLFVASARWQSPVCLLPARDAATNARMQVASDRRRSETCHVTGISANRHGHAAPVLVKPPQAPVKPWSNLHRP